MADDPALWSATRQAEAIRSKEVSSRELFDMFAARIERLNPTVNAVVTLDLERGGAAATAADEATARGDDLGPLHGLPITMKDALAVHGMRSTGGAVELTDHVPDTDADVVARVQDAGAFVFGKTNVPRWSGDLQTYNAIFGTTNNPWDPGRVPGGSSGGAATSVALGFTSFEVGTDIGGSIRVPSAYCGVAGHKPSFGLVPTGGYLDHQAGGFTEPDVNVHGPIARSVDDLDLLLGVLAGPAPDRARAWRVELPPPRHPAIADYRVALWPDDPACRVSADTVAAVEAAGQALLDAGAVVDRAARPDIDADAASRLGLGLVGAAVSPAMSDDEYAFVESMVGDPNLSEADAQTVAAYAASHRSWLAMDRDRALVRRAWASFFEHHDALVCPVIASPPFAHLHAGSMADRMIDIDGTTRRYSELLWWTVLIGMAYLPSTVIPAGRTADGLPVGVQIVGPYLDDRSTIAVARAVSGRLGGIEAPPLAAG
ncbi:MAG: amidase [Acidimicrobiales bacterium]